VKLFVVDASVAVRWLVQLPHHGEARALLAHQHRLIAPELIIAEVGSALTKLVRAKALSQAEGEGAFDDFFRAPVRLSPAGAMAPRAMKLALDHGQRFYDCLYLAMAETEGGLFATADARFCNAMRDTPHGKHMHFIGNPHP
jgi:predicted nucleic acid-binding protein